MKEDKKKQIADFDVYISTAAIKSYKESYMKRQSIRFRVQLVSGIN